MSTHTPRLPLERLVGIILVALSIASVIFVAVQTVRLSDATDCQSQYNDAYTTAIQERSSAARKERAAQRELLLTLLGGQVTPEQGRAAFDKYLKILDQADQARDEAAIPTRRC